METSRIAMETACSSGLQLVEEKVGSDSLSFLKKGTRVMRANVWGGGRKQYTGSNHQISPFEGIH